jgi:hypothetical protein
VIEVHERVGLPQLLAQFLAGDHISTSCQEEEKDVEGTSPKLELAALLSQLARAAVNLEGPNRYEVAGESACGIAWWW